jgi:D-glycero-alpha-D-manno-heptose-7-phosphate kinase
LIVVRAPLRISIYGGGTDFPVYFEKFGTEFCSLAIKKYVYVAINGTFTDYYSIKYLNYEQVKNIVDIKHPIIRAALQKYPLEDFVEIASFADIPAGSGLGSSSVFTVALLNGIFREKKLQVSALDIAKKCYELENNDLKELVGMQDSLISAVGGLTIFRIDRNGEVKHNSNFFDDDVLIGIQKHFLLVFTGTLRSASDVLNAQYKKSNDSENDLIESLDRTYKFGLSLKECLVEKDFKKFGEITTQHFKEKLIRTPGEMNKNIRNILEIGYKFGVFGAKVVGAGDGGFVLFICDDAKNLELYFKSLEFKCMTVEPDIEGTVILDASK